MNRHPAIFATALLVPLLITITGFHTPLIFAQNVGIGTTQPHPAALLHLADTTRGILLPKVPIYSLEHTAPLIATPSPGLLIFNPGTNGVLPPGFYWWDGKRWRRLHDLPATIHEEIITPQKLAARATFIELPSYVDSLDRYIDFFNGSSTTAGNFIWWYPLIPPGTLPDSQSYLIEITVVREEQPNDINDWDSDERYFLTDSTVGFGFAMPDKTFAGNCCQVMLISKWTATTGFTVLTGNYYGNANSHTIQQATMFLEMDSTTFIAVEGDQMSADRRWRASIRDTAILHPSRGLYLAMMRDTGGGTNGELENYRLRYIRIRILMR